MNHFLHYSSAFHLSSITRYSSFLKHSRKLLSSFIYTITFSCFFNMQRTIVSWNITDMALHSSGLLRALESCTTSWAHVWTFIGNMPNIELVCQVTRAHVTPSDRSSQEGPSSKELSSTCDTDMSQYAASLLKLENVPDVDNDTEIQLLRDCVFHTVSRWQFRRFHN